MELPNHDVLIVDVQRSPPPLAIYGQAPDKLPQSNTRINPQQTGNNGSNRLEDFADYTPGVQLGRNQAGIGSDVYLRGYPLNGNMQLDGLLDVQGFYLRDPATLESIEISKGLNSVLFGSGSPGGTLNYVSKQPYFSPQRSGQFTAGSPDSLHTVLDVNQPFAQTNWAGRLLMVGQQGETGRANVGDDRFTFLPSLLWQTAQQSLLLELEHGWQNREYDFDNVFYQGKPIYNVSYVDPRSYAQRRMNRVSGTYTRDWGNGWETLLQANQIDAKRDERWIGFAYLPASGTALPGYYRDAQYAQTQQALRAELSRHYNHGMNQHHTRLGVSGHSVEIDLKRQFRTGLFSLDLFNPTFDFPLPDADKLTKREAVTLRKERAVYWQHHAEIGDRWGIHAGVRNSQYQADYASPTLAFQETDAADTSTALGLTWQATPHWQAFASRNESFAPNIGMDKNEQFLAPLQGVQHEIGVRHQHETRQGKPLNSNLSVYRIDQENVTTRDPSEPGALMLTGKTRSQGVEANVSIPVSKKLTVNTAYNYSDARITANNDGNTGNHLHNIPRHSGSLTLDYTPNARTHLTLGAVKVGKRPGDDANSFDVPAYTRLDAGATWQLNRNTTLKAGVRNLLNEDYVAASEGVDFIVQGRKRTVTLGLEVDF
ncbi:TonB-dependent receptor [Thiothrix subterranea]|uniref:TonB-dependent receptor n=1 Tax=Thiothrix subterranea TaxID=2735563 RepID=UPI00192C7D4C|nr:TonB-dependent receptor [Thiothrix subterranea]QQZ30599.1 TonB-dependent receptor [Thiothrix subterranea]